MARWVLDRRPSGSGVAGGLALVLYLATLSRNWTGDSIEFAKAVESGHLSAFIEPHQMLIHPLAWAFYRLWQFLGWGGRALLPLQVLNALAGALCVGLMHRIVARIAGSERAAALVAAGFAVSYGPWLLSTEAEFVTVPLAVTLVLLWWILSASDDQWRRPRFAAGLGTAVGVAILTYQTSVFLIPAGVIGWLLADRLPRRERLWQSVRFSGAAVVTAAPIYLGVIFFLFDVRDWQALRAWQLRAGAGTVYGVLTWRDIPHGVYAFVRTLAGFPGIRLNDRTTSYWAGAALTERALLGAYYVVAAAVVAVPFVPAWFRRQELLQRHRRAATILGTWGLLFAAFAFYWVPGDVTFWLPVLVPWWILVGALLTVRGRASGAGTPRSRLSVPGSDDLWVLALCLMLLVSNGVGVVLPQRDLDGNRAYWVAMDMVGRTAPADLVIVSVDHPALLYVPYFAGRRTVAMYGRQPSVGPNERAVLRALEREIGEVHARGGHVWIVGPVAESGMPWANCAAEDPARRAEGRFRCARTVGEHGESIIEILPAQGSRRPCAIISPSRRVRASPLRLCVVVAMSETHTILVIEDDDHLSRLLKESLTMAGHNVLTASDGKSGLAVFESDRPDLLLLDVMMPWMDGWQVLERLRQVSDTPVIMLTSLDSVADRLHGFALGVDDYVSKPFSLAELNARVKAVLARATRPAALATRTPLAFGGITVDFNSRRVFKCGEPVNLSATAFRLLAALAENPGRAMSHEELLERAWGTEYTEQIHYVKRYIWFLRQEVEDDPSNPQYIQTVRGHGYRLVTEGSAGGDSAAAGETGEAGAARG